MRNRNLFKKLIVNTAIQLSVFSLFVFGCKNPIETPKITNEGSPASISITISGDVYLKEDSKKTFTVQKETTWAVVKNKDEIKKAQFKPGYQLSKWLLNGETGSELTDDFKFTKNTLLYAKSDTIPENSAYVSWEIDGLGGSLKAEYVVNGITKQLPMGGKKIPVGTKIAFTALPDKANYYTVDGWSHTGGGELSVSSDKLTASLSVQNKNNIKVKLKFIKEKADLNLKAEANGTLQAAWSSNTETVAENGTKKLSLEKGTTVELKAIPKPGYEFANWTTMADPKKNPNRITVTENIEVSAKFKKIIPVPKYIKLNGYNVDLTDRKVSVPTGLTVINQAEGKFTAGAAEITPAILIENGSVSLTEGDETEVILKVIAVDGQYGEWRQTIKVKRLSHSDLPDLILKSLKVHGEAADLNSMSVSIPNNKETITSGDIIAEFLRLQTPISNVEITVKNGPIQLEAGKETAIELSVQEKNGADGYKAWNKTLSVTRKIVPVTGIELSAAILSLEVGEQTTLTASIQPSNATNQKIEWKSDNNAAASVDKNGKVTAKGPGTAKITVKTLDGNIEKTCTVNVIQKFSVNFNVEGSGGTVEVKEGENKITSGSRLISGTVLNFKAISEEGFEILNWEGISADPPNVAVIQHQLTEDLNVKVKFKQKTYTVVFEANGGSPEPVTQIIKHGQKITEPPQMTLPEKEFEGWYKDDKFTSTWNFESDTVTENIRLYAKWDKIKITVKFDTEKIGTFFNDLESNPLGNNEKVYIGDKIYLYPCNIEEGKRPSWTINGKPSASIKPYILPIGIPHLFEYVVKEQDAENRIISFDYEAIQAAQLTIDYDGSVKRIFIPKNGAPEIPKGSKVYESTIIGIEPNLPAGKVIDKCLVNGKPVSGEIMLDCFIYNVKETDADNNKTLKFSFTQKTPPKGIIHWDAESPMTCTKCNENGKPVIPIENNTKVQEGDMLVFDANLPQGKLVDKWTVNGVEVSNGSDGDSNHFWLNVKAKHLESGTLTIGYTLKTASAGTIYWNDDANPMTCTKQNQHGPDTSITNGEQVQEGDMLVFDANLPQGKLVDKWTVNGVEVSNGLGDEYHMLRLNVKAKHLESGTLTIGYTLKTASAGTIYWNDDANPMTCTKQNQHGPDTSITNGDQVQEGDSLYFYANLPQGKLVDKWTVNGVKVSNGLGDEYHMLRLNVKAKHLESGTLTIGYTLKTASAGTIYWNDDANPMTCTKRNQHGPDTSITNGEQVQEEDRLDFYANLPQGKLVDKWTVNGVEISNGSDDGPNRFWLDVRAKHFKNGKLTIGYTLKTAAQTKVSFDGNIRCRVNRNGTNINVESDKTIVYEGESLDFKALGMPDSAVKNWKINNKNPQGWNGQENTGFKFYVRAAYISQASGGTVRVSCELKESLTSAALTFEPGKIKCLQNSYGNSYELNSGLKVYADIRLEFEALLSGSEQVKSWKINGIEQANSGHKNFSYMVQESDLIGDNFTVEIVLK